MNATSPSAAESPTPAGPSRLHILLLDPFFQRPDRPGSTRSYDLARRFEQAGHRVSVIATSALLKTKSPIADRMDVYAIRTYGRARFGYPAPDVGGTFARGLLWHIWHQQDVDAVLMTDRPLGALLIAAAFCAWRGIPLLVEARDGTPPSPDRAATFGKNIFMRCARGVFRLGLRAARHVIVLSEAAKSMLVRDGVRDSKIILSTPGADTTLFAAQPGASAAALTAYPQLAQGTLVVYAGRMQADRNLAAVIDLAAAAQPLWPEMTFALCGDGVSRGTLEARAQDLGVLRKNLWFLDALPRQDLPALLGAATAVLAVGQNGAPPDKTPGVFFDALAAGRPVILTGSGWQRDMIEGRGAGLGLPEHDITAAAHELVDFLKDSDGVRRASQQAAALAASKFSMDRVAAKLRGLIEETVAADPRQVVMRRRMLRTKRAMDIIISTVALTILSPVLIGLAIAIRIKMGGPVLFTQMRPGLKGKLFKIYKFRSMTSAKDASGALKSDGARLTAFGQALRRYSLDELPQLFNVLKGEMSIVGPRPLLPEYVPYYTAEQLRRQDVKPGITGWVQVNGRNALTWEEKFALDVWYVDNLSIALDIKILFKTIWIIITGHGVSAEGHATFERFDEIMARRQGAEDV